MAETCFEPKGFEIGFRLGLAQAFIHGIAELLNVHLMVWIVHGLDIPDGYVLNDFAHISKELEGVKLVYTCHNPVEEFFCGKMASQFDIAKRLINENNMQMIALHENMANDINKENCIPEAVVKQLIKAALEARKNAYEAINWVSFENKYYRNDIGKAIDEA